MIAENPRQPSPVRIAMWCGPRNISTAMMRSWGNRKDTVVIDEPFYAYYLSATGKQHPGVAEIIAHGETDWQKVAAQCLQCGTGRSRESFRSSAAIEPEIIYQKQMSHHLLPEVARDWLGDVTNCFLIRDPAEVITSYIKKNDDPALDDLGFIQQVEIFEWVRHHTGSVPPVIDAKDVLQNPSRLLRLLCHATGVAFDDAMLSWPSGPRATDGVWAKHWYGEVERSTSFQPYRAKNEPVPERLRAIHDRCRECYDELSQFCLL